MSLLPDPSTVMRQFRVVRKAAGDPDRESG